MKKLLLSASALLLATGAYAQLEGTYTVSNYECHTLSDRNTFDGGKIYTSDDVDFEPWQVEITKDGDNYVINNLFDWTYTEADETTGEETTYTELMNATFDAETQILTLGEFTGDYSNYGVIGGLGKYNITDIKIMELCDQYSSRIPAWDITPVTFKFEEDTLTMQTPCLIYEKNDTQGYWGYANRLYNELVLSKGDTGVKGVDVSSYAPVKYYNLQGVQITNPDAGQIVIVRNGNKSTKVVF